VAFGPVWSHRAHCRFLRVRIARTKTVHPRASSSPCFGPGTGVHWPRIRACRNFARRQIRLSHEWSIHHDDSAVTSRAFCSRDSKILIASRSAHRGHRALTDHTGYPAFEVVPAPRIRRKLFSHQFFEKISSLLRRRRGVATWLRSRTALLPRGSTPKLENHSGPRRRGSLAHHKQWNFHVVSPVVGQRTDRHPRGTEASSRACPFCL